MVSSNKIDIKMCLSYNLLCILKGGNEKHSSKGYFNISKIKLIKNKKSKKTLKLLSGYIITII